MMTLQEALLHCRDRDEYPEVFHDNDGADVQVVGHVTRLRWKEDNHPRKIKLTITSFKETDWEAIHYYGNIWVEGIEFSPEDDLHCFSSNNDTRRAEKENPLAKSSYSIELVRPLSQKEIDKAPGRWMYMREGSLVNSYISVQHIIDTVKEICKQRFIGNWQLQISDHTGSIDDKVININDL